MTQRTYVALRSIASCSGSGHAVAHDHQKRHLATKMLLKPCPSRKLLTILGTHKWQLSRTLNKASTPTSVSYRHEANEAEKWSNFRLNLWCPCCSQACMLSLWDVFLGKRQDSGMVFEINPNSTPQSRLQTSAKKNDANLVAPRRAAATSSWSGSEHSRTALNELTKSGRHLLTRSSARRPCLW